MDYEQEMEKMVAVARLLVKYTEMRGIHAIRAVDAETIAITARQLAELVLDYFDLLE